MKKDAIDKLLDRQPPCSPEAEQAVLGSILLLPSVLDDVAPILRPGQFYDDANEQIYASMVAMHEEGQRIDTMLLMNRLRRAGIFDSIGGAAYLAEVANVVPTAANAVHYAQIIRDKAILRALIHTGTEIVRGAYETPAPGGALAAWAIGQLSQIEDGHLATELVTSGQAISAALQRARQLRARGEGGGLPTGLLDYDQQIGGLFPGELVVIAARPGMGKTSLGLQWAVEAAPRRGTVLFVSLEMSAAELMTRVLCAAGQIDSAGIRTGHATDDDLAAMAEAGDLFDSLPLLIDDRPGVTVADIRRTARQIHRRQKLTMIVVDYLQRVSHDGDQRANRNEQVGRMSRSLKTLARELNVPVLALSQLNRESEKGTDHRPRLGHLRESGDIEGDADAVLLLHREEVYRADPDLRGQADLILAKNRSGRTPTIKLIWNPTTTTFHNAATMSQSVAGNW